MGAFLGLQFNNQYFDQYYPPNWPYTPNYFGYGYKIQNEGSNNGQPHLAFDIRAHVGTPTHAVWGGQIVEGLYDWKFGIENDFGIFYYNHIDPTVSFGDAVSRYDVVGKRNTEADHVHLEYRDAGFRGQPFEGGHPEKILELFTTMTAQDLLNNPLIGDPVPILPYFGN
jgi:hypothetical protein